MNIKTLIKNKLFIFLTTLYVVGLATGIIITSRASPKITQIEEDISVIQVLRTFAINYWYLFLIYLLGMTIIGTISNPIITFFRGFIFGVIITITFKAGIGSFFLYLLLELLLIFPSCIVMSYFSIIMSLSQFKRQLYINTKQYNKIMFIVLIVILVYSIIICLN